MRRPKNSTLVIQIVTYNSSGTIRSCIQSIKKQQYTDYKLIVIDNASTDGTPNLVMRMGVQCIRNRKNLGYAAGHNIGLQYGDSKFVLTLNPDVLLRKDYLTQLLSAMERVSESVGSAQSLLYRVDHMTGRSHIIDSAGAYMTPYRRQGLHFSGVDARTIVLNTQFIFGPDGAAALYRRAMLHDINVGSGAFDEDYFMHKEDIDICWRAQLRGWKSIFVPTAVAYHIRTFRAGHRSHIDQNIRAIAVRNRYYLMIKNELPSLFFRDIFWIVGYDLILFIYIIMREPSSLKAYGQLVCGLAGLLAKRSKIQSTKRVDSNYMSQWFNWSSI